MLGFDAVFNVLGLGAEILYLVRSAGSFLKSYH